MYSEVSIVHTSLSDIIKVIACWTTAIQTVCHYDAHFLFFISCLSNPVALHNGGLVFLAFCKAVHTTLMWIISFFLFIFFTVLCFLLLDDKTVYAFLSFTRRDFSWKTLKTCNGNSCPLASYFGIGEKMVFVFGWSWSLPFLCFSKIGNIVMNFCCLFKYFKMH